MMIQNKKEAKISLVGAGPGDPDLLTVKGMKTIQTADVIFYDALVNPALLDHAPNHIEKIYVGKRANIHRYTQDEINILLVQYAYTHGHVVRLKGGDSFVFGRGHEEMSFAANFGIEVDIVPGVSSCISVPELQGIPVTCRGVSESFWVLTGTTKAGKLSDDIALAVKSTATVVILMGIRKIREISKLYCMEGKSDVPVMVVQNGSLENQKVVFGTTATIGSIVEREKIGTPGIIIIGEVVGLHDEYNYMCSAYHKRNQP